MDICQAEQQTNKVKNDTSECLAAVSSICTAGFDDDVKFEDD